MGAGHRGSPDPVNQPMIRHWCEAMGDDNPVYTDRTRRRVGARRDRRPPVMLQAWIMRGHHGPRPTRGGHRTRRADGLLDGAGFTSVVATNCEQEYRRYAAPGRPPATTRDRVGVRREARPALGVGHFVTHAHRYPTSTASWSGRMRFRILKFKPGADENGRESGGTTGATAAAAAGDHAGQRVLVRGRAASTGCSSSGAGSAGRCATRLARCATSAVARVGHGRGQRAGTVYSFVVIHYPQVAGVRLPARRRR